MGKVIEPKVGSVSTTDPQDGVLSGIETDSLSYSPSPGYSAKLVVGREYHYEAENLGNASTPANGTFRLKALQRRWDRREEEEKVHDLELFKVKLDPGQSKNGTFTAKSAQIGVDTEGEEVDVGFVVVYVISGQPSVAKYKFRIWDDLPVAGVG